MADTLITPTVGATMYVASGITAAYCFSKIKKENDTSKIPLMGIMSAFVFSAQMVNFTIPGTGSSGHICGGLLLSTLIGPYAAFISMIAILLLQCLLFADGGILALGCNIWNMAFYACFFGYFCIYKPLTARNQTKLKTILACVLASTLSLQFGAFSVVLETLISGVSELPFGTFVALMQPIHIAIGIVEGLITSAVVLFIQQTRPELLSFPAQRNSLSYKKVLVILSVITVVIGGGISLLASSNPDGLEWSILNTTGSEEIENSADIYSTMSNVQEKTALLPDYSLPQTDNEVLGTSFSGIVGALIVCLFLIIFSFIFKLYKKEDGYGFNRKSNSINK